MGRRKKHDSAFKLKVALEAIKEELIVSEKAGKAMEARVFSKCRICISKK